MIGPPPQLKLSDQSVQITSSRNEVLDELYRKYSELIKEPYSMQQQDNTRLYAELSNDAAITPLLPYFRKYLTNIPVTGDAKYTPVSLNARLALARALFNNKNISLHNELTQLIGLCLSAIKLNTQDSLFEYVSLRENAAELLRDIINRFSDTYTNLRRRIVDYLLTVFLESRKFPVKLGTAIGLSIIGSELVRTLLIPKIPLIIKNCENLLRDVESRIQFLKFKAVLMKIAGDCFNADTLESYEKTGTTTLPEDVANMYNELIPFFGTDFFMYTATKPQKI